jgi:hypothetical protein
MMVTAWLHPVAAGPGRVPGEAQSRFDRRRCPAGRAVAPVCGSAGRGGCAGRLLVVRSSGAGRPDRPDIAAARRGRISTVAVAVDDPGAGISCRLNSTWQFYSASVIKATILGAAAQGAGASPVPDRAGDVPSPGDDYQVGQ